MSNEKLNILDGFCLCARADKCHKKLTVSINRTLCVDSLRTELSELNVFTLTFDVAQRIHLGAHTRPKFNRLKVCTGSTSIQLQFRSQALAKWLAAFSKSIRLIDTRRAHTWWQHIEVDSGEKHSNI